MTIPHNAVKSIETPDNGGKERLIMADVINASGKAINFKAAAALMDDDIRETIAGTVDTEQEFFTAYEKAHKKRFGEPWELSKANPVW